MHMDHAGVCLDASATDRESQTEARAIAASLFESQEEFIDLPGREASALVADLDQHPLLGRDALSDTWPSGRVNLKAFCRRLPSAAVRS